MAAGEQVATVLACGDWPGGAGPGMGSWAPGERVWPEGTGPGMGSWALGERVWPGGTGPGMGSWAPGERVWPALGAGASAAPALPARLARARLCLPRGRGQLVCGGALSPFLTAPPTLPWPQLALRVSSPHLVSGPSSPSEPHPEV